MREFEISPDIENIMKICEFLGLSQIQSKTYAFLIKSREIRATNISRVMRMHRSNVYDTLNILSDKGFLKEEAIKIKAPRGKRLIIGLSKEVRGYIPITLKELKKKCEDKIYETELILNKIELKETPRA